MRNLKVIILLYVLALSLLAVCVRSVYLTFGMSGLKLYGFFALIFFSATAIVFIDPFR